MFTIPYPYASKGFTRFYCTKFQCYDTFSGLLYSYNSKGALVSSPSSNPNWGYRLGTIPELLTSKYPGLKFSTFEEAEFAHAFILNCLKQQALDYASTISARVAKLPDTSSTISNFQSLHPEHFL